MRAQGLVAFTTLALAGCGGDEAVPLNEQQLSETIVNVAEARPEPKGGPPRTALVAVRREDLQEGLPPGAGCDFSNEGQLLFVAVNSGRALAKVNGIATPFAASGPVGPSGGFFVTERYSVSIGRLDETGVTIGTSRTWPARLVLTDRRREENGRLRLEGTWRCGG